MSIFDDFTVDYTVESEGINAGFNSTSNADTNDSFSIFDLSASESAALNSVVDATASAPASPQNDTWAAFNGFVGNLINTATGAITGVKKVNAALNSTNGPSTPSVGSSTYAPRVAPTPNDKLMESLAIGAIAFFAFK